jgi:hypothetical protein
MNTLSDLRSTLDEHAEQIPDGEVVVRTAAVHHRVSVVRRRRRAVGAGVLSLALLVGGAASLANRGHHDAFPVAPTVLGVKAPDTITSLGYTYRSDGSAQTFDDHGTILVDESTQPRLLTWTTDRPTTVRILFPALGSWTSTVSAFHDSVVIPPGPGGKLQVDVDSGRVGVATYDLTDAQPDGATRDGITFRRTVAGTPLLSAAIGAAGQTKLHTSLSGVRGPVRIAVLCAGVPSDSLVHVVMAGAENTAGCGDTSFDPGSDVVGTSPLGHAGRTLPVRVWVSGPGTDRPPSPASADGVRIGVGLYGPVAADRVAGTAMDRTIEYGGHTWSLAEVDRSSGSPIRLNGRRDPTVAQVNLAVHSNKPTFLTFLATETSDQKSGFGGPGSGSTGPFWVPSGATVRATRSTPGAFGVGIYTRAD